MAAGFARIVCSQRGCKTERMVAYACKGRCICPSCVARRMADCAAHLVDHLMPVAPYRQWTLSLPYAVRFRIGYDPRLVSEVLASAQTESAAAGEKLTKLDVQTLQARYLEVVGRSTGSDNKAYLIWKIREAQKGRIPVGPRKSSHREGVTFKVLPLRMESDLVDKLDEAWKRQGLHSRMDLFRDLEHEKQMAVQQARLQPWRR